MSTKTRPDADPSRNDLARKITTYINTAIQTNELPALRGASARVTSRDLLGRSTVYLIRVRNCVKGAEGVNSALHVLWTRVRAEFGDNDLARFFEINVK